MSLTPLPSDLITVPWYQNSSREVYCCVGCTKHLGQLYEHNMKPKVKLNFLVEDKTALILIVDMIV